jgi:sulfite reductase beta subunit
MTEGPPRPYVNYVPPQIARNVGKWRKHKILEPGVLEHVSSSGDRIYTVRAASTSNCRYCSETIRRIAELADRYCSGYMRYTAAGNMEFILDDLSKLKGLKRELDEMGFPVGGWGGHLWSITSCAGYFHCALAATDAPSIAKSVGDAVFKYFKDEELPGKLSISISGCPSACGGSFLPDLSIIGIHTEVPIVTEDSKSCDLTGTMLSCPVGAIEIKQEGGQKTIEIREKLCIGCGLCVGACKGIIFETPEETDGHVILVGGKASSPRTGTQMGRVVVPYLPNEPPRYELTVKLVLRIINAWKKDAKKGERLSTWIGRIGWEKFFERTGIPFYEQSMEDLDMRALTTLRVGGSK